MNKVKVIIVCLFFFICLDVSATSGSIRQSSVIECNGVYYGNHGSPVHWHIVEKKNDKWVSVSKEVDVPSCYLKPVNTKEEVKFYKCSDGDTAHFIINGVNRTVRFLAIDTPEVAGSDHDAEFMANEASEYTCNALKNAKKIYLEYDTNSDKEDKYGRVLAFVHVDDELLEAKLIENGLAKVAYIYGDYAYVLELREKEALAKEKKIGIWQEVNLPDQEESNSNSQKENISNEESLLLKILKWILYYLDKIFDFS